jgi:hypothetical protein
MRPISYTKLATKVKPIINSVEVHGGGVHRQTLQLRASIYNIHVAFGIMVRRGVSNHGLAIYIKKIYLEAKEELWKFEYFTMQKYNLQKKTLKKKPKSFKIFITL